MKEYDDYSAKEKKQLAVCQRLITEKSYLSQEEIRRDLQNHGFDSISPQLLPTPDAGRSVAEMVLSVEHNGEFILIHTVAGYGRAVARILDFHALPEILGVIAGSNIVWVAPRVVKRTALVHKQINYLLKLNIYS